MWKPSSDMAHHKGGGVLSPFDHHTVFCLSMRGGMGHGQFKNTPVGVANETATPRAKNVLQACLNLVPPSLSCTLTASKQRRRQPVPSMTTSDKPRRLGLDTRFVRASGDAPAARRRSLSGRPNRNTEETPAHRLGTLPHTSQTR